MQAKKSSKRVHKYKIEELKLMQLYPRLYLANYFSELKRQVDLDFFYKMEENEKYMVIINRIELFENDSYKRIMYIVCI